MTRAFSRYLDGTRVFAALLVFVSHFAYARFSGGEYLWVRTFNLGSDAVIVFFVLSGFIIDFTAEVKDTTVGRFAFNRATRVYSVAIPALLVTLIFDQLGARWYPSNYSGWWYEGRDAPLSVVTALTFTNELWFSHIRPGSNGPYWSLTYEVWYYAIFAALRFGTGTKRVAIATALAIVAGPKILLLSPPFALGVWVHRATRRGEARFEGFALLYAVGAPLLYLCLLFLHAPAELRAMTESILGADFVRTKLRFSDEFLWNNAIGGLVALHVVGIHRLSRSERRAGSTTPSPVKKQGSFVHFLAGASFSLYLVHYPTLQLAASALPGDVHSGVRQLFLFLGVLVFCFGFAALFERRLPELRSFLRERFLSVPSV